MKMGVSGGSRGGARLKKRRNDGRKKSWQGK